jgi:predicted porin
MKRLLPSAALICASAFCSSPAFAQASVTLYGIIDTALEYQNVGAGNTAKMDSGVLNGSRWGIRGTEDLGGGVQAIFALENGFNMNNGTLGNGGLLFGRQSWVGVRSDYYGQISFGRHYSVLHTFLSYYTNGLVWGNASNYFRDGNVLRLNNSIRYVSPNVYGLTFGAIYAFSVAGGTGASDSVPAGNVKNVSLTYTYGPFSVGGTYMASQTKPSDLDQYTIFGLAYDFGFTRASAVYSIRRDDLPAATSASQNFFEVATFTPIGVGSLLLSYGQSFGKARPNTDAKAYAIRYAYPLSKRTVIYGGFTQIRNESGAAFTINTASNSGTIAAPGKSPRMLMVGYDHSF